MNASAELCRHCSSDREPTRPSEASSAFAPVERRRKRACETCRVKHTTCGSERPCRTCRSLGVSCHVAEEPYVAAREPAYLDLDLLPPGHISATPFFHFKLERPSQAPAERLKELHRVGPQSPSAGGPAVRSGVCASLVMVRCELESEESVEHGRATKKSRKGGISVGDLLS
jgi:hypothetical protein